MPAGCAGLRLAVGMESVEVKAAEGCERGAGREKATKQAGVTDIGETNFG